MKYRILNIMVTVIAVAAILFALATLWTVITTERGKAPQFMGFSVLQVVTGSMEPEIPVGSVVLARKTNASELREGDVIAFYSSDPQISGAVNTHRIVERVDEDGALSFVTKGDANPAADYYPVIPENVVGKVVFHSRILGLIAGFAGNKLGFLLLVLIPLAAIFFCNAKEVVRLIRLEMKKIEEEEMAQLEQEVGAKSMDSKEEENESIKK